MEPEKEDGNIEYKRKLTDVTDSRIEHLASQMRYRCDEGKSECIYDIGVDDDGTMIGVTEDEYNQTLSVLESAATKNAYIVSLLSKMEIDSKKNVYEVLVRENNQDTYSNVKILTAGNVNSGKSSLLGVLVNGTKDNGRGSARLSIFNFPHEVKTGRTSSIAQHILGYDATGKIVNYREVGKQSWPEIVRESAKIISFFDLAGHEKHLKTTILGLSTSMADLCFIMVEATRGVQKMTKEHLFLCITLGIPFAIIITKIDMVKDKQNVLATTVQDINKMLNLPGVRRINVKVDTYEDVITCAKNIHSESVVPIFYVSNVTGEGIDKLRYFLNLIPAKNNIPKSDKVQIVIESTFSVPGVGTVIGGNLITGIVNVGDTLYIGPDNNGKYDSVSVKSIHCKKVPVQKVESGCYVCLALRKIERSKIRKGNVLLSQNSEKIACMKFKAKINVLHAHSTTIREGKYEPVVHTHAMRQSARLLNINDKRNARKITIDDNILRTGDKANIVLEFRRHPEYITPGMRILLCEGRTKVVGIVTEIFKM